MNIMNAFRNIVNPNQAPQQTLSNGIPMNAPQMNNTANPTVPNMADINAQAAQQPPQQVEKSPSEQLAELWKIEPPKEPKAAIQAPTLNFDPAKVQQLSQGMDFTRNLVTQDDLAKIVAGGPDAVNVLMQTMNKVGQNVFAQATLANAKIVQGSLDANATNLQAALPSMVKTHTMQEAIVNSNPVFNDPAVAPILDILKQQLVQAYPNATAQEIQAHANKAVLNLGKVVGAQDAQTTQTAQVQRNTGAPDNWINYLTN